MNPGPFNAMQLNFHETVFPLYHFNIITVLYSETNDISLMARPFIKKREMTNSNIAFQPIIICF